MNNETSEIKEALEIIKDKKETVKLSIEGKEYTATLHPIDAEGATDMLVSLLVEDKTANPKLSRIKKMFFSSPETIARCIQLEPEYKGDLTAWLKRHGVQYALLALKVYRISDPQVMQHLFMELVRVGNEMALEE